MVPAVSPAAAAYDAARRGVAMLDRSDRATIVVSGRDRASYLQGLFTNDVGALGAGQGCYTAYLTPQGRMIAELWVYELGDVMLLALPAGVKDAVLSRLDQFVFSEDVQLGDTSARFTARAVVGPGAAGAIASALEGAAVEALEALPEHGNLRARMGEHAAVVARVTDTGEPGFDVFIEAAGGPALEASLARAGAVAADGAVAEILRVEAGVPRFHRDMDEDTIPLEAGIEARAISLTKGCYVGQEVIIRVLHRGHGRIARRLVGLTVEGDRAPEPGVGVEAEGREIGRVTSGVVSIGLGRPIALGYVARDFVAPGTSVMVGGRRAVVTALPFVPAAAEPRAAGL